MDVGKTNIESSRLLILIEVGIGFGLLILIGVGIGFYFETSQSIPDNALVTVFPSHGYWLPHAPFVGERLSDDLVHPTRGALTLELLTDLTPATWEDVRTGEYQRFTLPPGWATSRDNYTTGRARAILITFIVGPDRRWNEDGSWNY